MDNTMDLSLIATQTALSAGALLRRGFGAAMEIQTKEGKHNLVTEWDKKSEELIIETIKKRFPTHKFLAEEGGTIGTNTEEIQWIIDPLDGTVNFAHNIPVFAVSIAATLRGEVLAGAVYSPMLQELFVAEKGKGAFLNGKELRVTDTPSIEEAILGTGFPYHVSENPLHALEHFHAFAKMGTPLRRMGCASIDLAYVAAGRFDAFWEVSLEPWDYAASKLIIEEAGGTFTDLAGNPFTALQEGPVLATNGKLLEEMIQKLQQTMDDASH